MQIRIILTIDMSDLAELSSVIESFTDSDVLSIVPNDADGGAQDLGSQGTNEIMARLEPRLPRLLATARPWVHSSLA